MRRSLRSCHTKSYKVSGLVILIAQWEATRCLTVGTSTLKKEDRLVHHGVAQFLKLSQDSWRGPIEANLLRGTSRIRPERDIEIVLLLGSLPRQIDIDRLSDLSPPPVFI